MSLGGYFLALGNVSHYAERGAGWNLEELPVRGREHEAGQEVVKVEDTSVA